MTSTNHDINDPRDDDPRDRLDPHLSDDDPTDVIAQVAARLLETGAVTSVAHAIEAAVRELGWQTQVSRGHVATPGLGRIRAHARGLAMEMLGDVGYAARIDDVFRIAEQIMTVLEAFDPMLVGRAANAQIDVGVTLYLRVYVEPRVGIGDLAAVLVSHEYEEPTFSTAQTKFGRFSRLALEEEGIPVVVTRCLQDQRRLFNLDLFSGKRLPVLDLPGIRARLEERP